MQNPIFSAKFITAGLTLGEKCPIFMKKFSIDGAVKRAVMHVSALGVYEAKINGKRICNDYMLPGWTEYKKRLQYQSYDVTSLLAENNEIRIGAGHGWWGLKINDERRVFGTPKDYPSVIAALEITFNDGKKLVIPTDESWKYCESAVQRSHIYHGEVIDNRIEILPYEKCSPVSILDTDKSVLIPHEGPYVREIERLGVKKIIHSPMNETILDFGQEITGTVEFTLDAEGGERIKLYHGEVLDKDGNFYNANYREAEALIDYTASSGRQTYKAYYTFFGFRYIKVEGWPGEITKESFSAIVLHSDMKRTGYFKCGHAKLNKLYENIIWGQRDNYLDIPTDCPQRDERLGWTGDTQMFARTGAINYDTEKFFLKWLRDAQASQFDNGGMPHTVPRVAHWPVGLDSSAAWGDAACIVPWEIYFAYNNKALLKECYPMMKKWVHYILNMPGKKYLWQNGNHFGDWLGLDAPAGSYLGSTNCELIATAFFYRSTCILTEASKVLGYKHEKYEEMAKKIKSAFLSAYVKRGKLISDTQTAHVLTLHFGLVDDIPELKSKLADRLIELVEAAGDALQTGFVGTPYLLDVLTEIGRPDKAYKLLLREEFPSWLFSVNMGATTVWEHWDSMREDGSFWSTDMNSFNHYAYGACASWFYRTICGIKPLDPGYRVIEIAPIPSRELGFAKARIETRSGTVMSGWTYETEGVRYTFTVPDGVVAHVRIDGSCYELAGGSYTMWGKA